MAKRSKIGAGPADQPGPDSAATAFERCQQCQAALQETGASAHAAIFNIGRDLFAESNIESLLSLALVRLAETSAAEHIWIALVNPDGDIERDVAHRGTTRDLDMAAVRARRRIMSEVGTSGKTVCARLQDKSSDRGCDPGANQQSYRDFLCLPLFSNGRPIGAIYLEHETPAPFLSRQQCDILHLFAMFISQAVSHAVEREQLASRVNSLEAELRGKYHFEAIIGHDHQMVQILKLISQIAATDTSVLVQGESGTGKELIARAIHFNSHRNTKPFVPINCGGIPKNLLESELFGHVRGAFTGAFQNKVGWFERAHGGTLFLDEISEMPLDLQVRLLRIIQTGEYSRVGSTEIRFCDVRILAASSRDLLTQVHHGAFREDLYYRLNVIDIHLPPLRERKCDILLLARHLLRIYGDKYGKKPLRLSGAVEDALLTCDFPGNVRELENAIQHAVVLAEGDEIELQHLPAGLQPYKAIRPPQFSPFRVAKAQAISTFEREYIAGCLRATRGLVRRAARLAGMDVKNFHTKMKKYGIDPLSFRQAGGDPRQD